MWKPGLGHKVNTLRGRGLVALSPDGSVLATHGDGKALFYDISSGRVRHQADCDWITYDHEGSKLACAKRNVVRILKVANYQVISEFLVDARAELNSLAFSPDGRSVIVAVDDNTVSAWDVVSGRRIGVFGGHVNAILDWHFSVTERMASTVSSDGRVIVRSGDDYATVREFRWSEKPPALRDGNIGAKFSPNGKYMAAFGGGSGAKLWDVESGQALSEISGGSSNLDSVAFDPSSTFVLFATSDARFFVWNIAAKRLTFNSHVGISARPWDGVACEATYFREGARILGVCTPRGRSLVVILDPDSGHELGRITGYADMERGPNIAIDRAGLRIAGPSTEEQITVWRLFPSLQAMIDDAKAVVPRCFSAVERAAHFLSPESPTWCRDRTAVRM